MNRKSLEGRVTEGVEVRDVMVVASVQNLQALSWNVTSTVRQRSASLAWRSLNDLSITPIQTRPDQTRHFSFLSLPSSSSLLSFPLRRIHRRSRSMAFVRRSFVAVLLSGVFFASWEPINQSIVLCPVSVPGRATLHANPRRPTRLRHCHRALCRTPAWWHPILLAVNWDKF